MNFAFPKIENQTVYPRTFLKDVCVSLCFRTVLSYEDAINNFVTFRKTDFDIPVEEHTDLKSQGEDGSAKIVSSDNLVLFQFYLDAVSIKIKYPAYKQFGDLLQYLRFMVGYVESQGVKIIETLKITKFNEIQYGFQSDSTPVQQAMRGIFSPELMGWDGFENPDFSDVARWERRIDFSDDHANAKAMVIYGFAKDDNDKKRGVLTLKTSIEKNSPIKLDSFNDELILCNDYVDSAFHWAASQDILNAMRKK